MSVDRPRPLVAGNWKMNGLKSSAKVLEEIHAGYTPGLKAKVELAVCPPATLIGLLAKRAIGSRIAVGGQDCHAKESINSGIRFVRAVRLKCFYECRSSITR